MNGLRKFGESAANAVLERVGRGVSKVQERKPLPYDLLESADAYLVVFDAPGVERGDVQVRFVDGAVEVRLDRFRDFHEGFEMRFPGRGLGLSGTAHLPDDASVEPAGASATLTRSGTLQVRVPKDERARNVAVADEDETVDTELGGGSGEPGADDSSLDVGGSDANAEDDEDEDESALSDGGPDADEANDADHDDGRDADRDDEGAGETSDTGTGGADGGAADEADSVGGSATVDETNTGDVVDEERDEDDDRDADDAR